MIPRPAARDERTTAIENAGYRRSYLLLSYGVLAAAAFRGFGRDEQPWDLLGLVVVTGFLQTIYQAWHKVVYRRWLLMVALTIGSAALLAAILVAARRH